MMRTVWLLIFFCLVFLALSNMQVFSVTYYAGTGDISTRAGGTDIRGMNTTVEPVSGNTTWVQHSKQRRWHYVDPLTASTVNTSAPATTPVGYGWSTNSTIRGTILTGTWTAILNTSDSAGTGVGYMSVNVFKNCSGGAATQIYFLQNGTYDVMAAGFLKVYLVKSGVAAQDFTAGCYLRTEYWLNVTTASGTTNSYTAITAGGKPGTMNFQIPTIVGNLTVTTNGTNRTINQNSTYVIQATVSCQGSDDATCGSPWVGLRFNASGSTPNARVNTTVGNAPFYNFSGLNPQSCGALTGGQTCTANWTINATGANNTAWWLDANATSGQTGMIASNSTAFNLNITVPAAVAYGFSLTIPSANFSNSTQTYPGAPTSALNFSYNQSLAAATGYQYYVNPCVGATASCQTTSTPVYIFTNTGNVNIGWAINTSLPLPFYVRMFANKSDGSNPSVVDVINTTAWTVNASIPPGQTQNLWVWVNFTGALNVPEVNETNLTSRGY